MICQCQYCDTVTGQKDPLEDKNITHGLCAICQPLFEQRLRPEEIREQSLLLRKRSRKVLEAIDILLGYYSRFPTTIVPRDYGHARCTRCPLCVAIKSRRGDLPARRTCRACPWVVFEGAACVTKRFGDHTAAQRIERLNKWRKTLLEGAGE